MAQAQMLPQARALYQRAIEFVRQRRTAYCLAFSSPAGQEVLIDLAKFCRAAESCAVPGDHDKTLILEGRREVFLRIQQHLRLTPDQLYSLFGGQHFNVNQQESEQ